MILDACDDNPYEAPGAPGAAELPAMARVQLKPPGLAAFVLAGLYAALLTAPLIAVYQLTGYTVGLKFIASSWYVAVFSCTGMGIAALGDGLTAIMCWKTVANRPRSVPLIAAAVGGRILAALLQGAVLVNAQKSVSNVNYIAAVSLHYGVPSVILTAVSLRLSNRRVSFWVYPTIYIAASVAGPMLSRSTWMIVTSMFGIVGTAERVFVNTASQSLYLCFLAAALWFGVRVSRPTLTPSSSTP